MRISYTLSLPAEAGSVPAARSICRANLALLKVGEASIDDVTVALTDACANVVKHAGGHRYQVRMSVDDALCQIEVTDGGIGVDPAAGPSRDPDDPLPDRRGQLMQSLVDELDFVRGEDATGTTVRLQLPLQLDPGSPLSEPLGT